MKLISQHNSCQSSLDELSIKQEQLTLKEEMISDLQDELVKVRLRDAENEAMIRDLKDKIGELEHVSTHETILFYVAEFIHFYRTKKLFENQWLTILLHTFKKN